MAMNVEKINYDILHWEKGEREDKTISSAWINWRLISLREGRQTFLSLDQLGGLFHFGGRPDLSSAGLGGYFTLGEGNTRHFPSLDQLGGFGERQDADQLGGFGERQDADQH